ncbi:hypothetical protein L210DRAFT_247569 [Boletus edulis BED1]|uniref:Uncharacterized protein n=1 Tax=Boletus edulis BED1 TaxID=1328754 RepID=A0AAD4BJ28_BOLED|nr:hypothetical protein L210DRAFT_247569 [Boletus edulis BED1]
MLHVSHPGYRLMALPLWNQLGPSIRFSLPKPPCTTSCSHFTPMVSTSLHVFGPIEWDDLGRARCAWG